eukprot:jgi/Orpsp1_1/1177531/evm.model.c7180000061824.2
MKRINSVFILSLLTTSIKASSECWSEPIYPCCTGSNFSYIETDSNGSWSIENGDWCGIPKEEEQKPLEECWSESLGYP